MRGPRPVRAQGTVPRHARLRAWWLALVLAALLPGAYADTTATATVAGREDAFAAAIGGRVEALEELLAADFFYNTARGSALTKQAMIAQLASGEVRVRSLVREDAVIRVHGDTALVSGVARVAATVGGEDVDVASRYLHVWVRERDAWRLAARQVTPLAH